MIIKRKVYTVSGVRRAVLHNPMKHFFLGKLEQCSQYPVGNDHISPTVNGTFESMVFFIRWDMLVSWTVVWAHGSCFFPTDGSPIESFVACMFQFGINIL